MPLKATDTISTIEAKIIGYRKQFQSWEKLGFNEPLPNQRDYNVKQLDKLTKMFFEVDNLKTFLTSVLRIVSNNELGVFSVIQDINGTIEKVELRHDSTHKSFRIRKPHSISYTNTQDMIEGIDHNMARFDEYARRMNEDFSDRFILGITDPNLALEVHDSQLYGHVKHRCVSLFLDKKVVTSMWHRPYKVQPMPKNLIVSDVVPYLENMCAKSVDSITRMVEGTMYMRDLRRFYKANFVMVCFVELCKVHERLKLLIEDFTRGIFEDVKRYKGFEFVRQDVDEKPMLMRYNSRLTVYRGVSPYTYRRIKQVKAANLVKHNNADKLFIAPVRLHVAAHPQKAGDDMTQLDKYKERWLKGQDYAARRIDPYIGGRGIGKV